MSNGVEVDAAELVGLPGFDPTLVDVALTGRNGGTSSAPYDSLNLALHVGDDHTAVLANRHRVAAAFRADLVDFVFCDQVHRPTVAFVGPEHRGRGSTSRDDALPATDAMVTTTPGLVLAVLVADCLPLVLHDPLAGVLGVVHAGWRGTVADVTGAAVRAMTAVGADPANIVAGIGPGIAASAYQVGRDVVEAAERAFAGRAVAVIAPDDTGRWTFDLVAANTERLRDAGLPDQQIHRSGWSTGPGTPFYSHRAGAPTGRFAALARLKDRS